MKKIIFLILIVLSTFSYSQSKYETIKYIDWGKSNSGYWTEHNSYAVYNDFDWCVTRSKYKIGGYYYFDFWFYSQSYYWDGQSPSYTSTNIRDVSVYFDNIFILSDNSTLGISFYDVTNPSQLRIKAVNPTPYIIIKWDYMSAL